MKIIIRVVMDLGLESFRRMIRIMRKMMMMIKGLVILVTLMTMLRKLFNQKFKKVSRLKKGNP